MLWVWLVEDSEIIKLWNSDVVCFAEKLKYALRDSKAGAYLHPLKQEQLSSNFFAACFFGFAMWKLQTLIQTLSSSVDQQSRTVT